MKIQKRWVGLIIIIVLILGTIIYASLPKSSDSLEEFIYEPASPEFLAEHPKTQEFSVHITGEEMRFMTIHEVASLWNIEEDALLNEINEVFEVNATLSSKLISVLPPGHKNGNYKLVKEIAESHITFDDEL